MHLGFPARAEGVTISPVIFVKRAAATFIRLISLARSRSAAPSQRAACGAAFVGRWSGFLFVAVLADSSEVPPLASLVASWSLGVLVGLVAPGSLLHWDRTRMFAIAGRTRAGASKRLSTSGPLAAFWLGAFVETTCAHALPSIMQLQIQSPTHATNLRHPWASGSSHATTSCQDSQRQYAITTYSNTWSGGSDSKTGCSDWAVCAGPSCQLCAIGTSCSRQARYEFFRPQATTADWAFCVCSPGPPDGFIH